MIKTLAKSLREYKRESILSPLLVSGEVIMEVIIPFLMAKLIDHMGERSIQPVVYYGVQSPRRPPAGWQRTCGRTSLTAYRPIPSTTSITFRRLPWLPA